MLCINNFLWLVWHVCTCLGRDIKGRYNGWAYRRLVIFARHCWVRRGKATWMETWIIIHICILGPLHNNLFRYFFYYLIIIGYSVDFLHAHAFKRPNKVVMRMYPGRVGFHMKRLLWKRIKKWGQYYLDLIIFVPAPMVQSDLLKILTTPIINRDFLVRIFIFICNKKKTARQTQFNNSIIIVYYMYEKKYSHNVK